MCMYGILNYYAFVRPKIDMIGLKKLFQTKFDKASK